MPLSRNLGGAATLPSLICAVLGATAVQAGPCDDPLTAASGLNLETYLRCETCADQLLDKLASSDVLSRCLEEILSGPSTSVDDAYRRALASAYGDTVLQASSAVSALSALVQSEDQYVESDIENMQAMRRVRAAIALTKRPIDEVRSIVLRAIAVLKKSARPSDRLIVELLEEKLAGQ
jgi:hypothetical protein